MKKLLIILGLIILTIIGYLALQPKTLGTSTRTKTVYLDRENNFTATTTLQKGFVSTSTPTQAGQIVGLDEDGKLPAVGGGNLTDLNESDSYVVLASEVIRTSAGTYYGTPSEMTKVKEVVYNNIAGTIRVKMSVTGNSNNNARVRFYVNGVAVGTDYGYIIGTTERNYSEDISVNPGDLVQVYGEGRHGLSINSFTLGYLKTPKITADTINL